MAHDSATLPPRIVWLDVDGTSETGNPSNFDACVANRSQPPLGRDYNYNYPLFEALKVASDVDKSSVMLFTAYDAAGASHNQGVIRAELLDWIAASHPQLTVAGVATVIDPAFGHGPGAYYRSVIEPCERLLLSKGVAEGPEGLAKLIGDDEIQTLSPEDWATVVPQTFAEILNRQQDMVDAHLKAFSDPTARMDKERLARYCLPASAEAAQPRVLFLDDRLSYIDQVERACSDLGVDCRSVHVTPEMRNTDDFLQAIAAPARKRSSLKECIIS